jgi:hypothetical protein
MLIAAPPASSVGAVVQAADTSSASAVSYPLPLDNDLSLFALEYECPLASFGLVAGPLHVATFGAGGRGIPQPGAVERADLSGGNTSAWTRAASVPADLLQIRLLLDPSSPDPCAHFEGTELSFGNADGARVTAAVALGPDDGLFFIDGGVVDRAMGTLITPIAGLRFAFPTLAAFRRDDQTTWLLGRAGQTAFGKPELSQLEVGPTLVASSSSSAGWAALDGAPGGSIELFAATAEGLSRFDGSSWHVLSSSGAHPVSDEELSVAWAGPHEAYATAGGPSILHAVGGAVTAEALPIASSDHPTVVALIPRLGVAVGTSLGAIALKQGNMWRRLDPTPTAGRVRAIVPLDDGLLFGGAQGVLTEWRPIFGYCPPLAYAPRDVARLVPLGTGYLLLEAEPEHDASSPTGETTATVRLTRTDIPAPPCAP